MKKTILSIAVIAAAIFAASCQKENLQENTASEGSAFVFTTSIETGANTKTFVERIEGTTATYKTKWESTDKISINGVIYTATPDGTDATKATFTKDSDTQTDPTGTFKAYFPADMYSDSKATLPASYTYADGDAYPEKQYNMPMYAQSSTTSLPFKNLCGVLVITVNGTDFTSVSSIEVSSDKQMNGEFTVTDDCALKFKTEGVTLTDDNKKVTLTFASAKAIDSEGSATFYIPVPAGTHNPLTIKVTSGSTTNLMVTKKSGGVAVARNTVYPIAFDGQPITGTATRTGGNVNWVQLWAGGPKFAEYNVGASNATEVGYEMTFMDATKTGSNYVWGANWRTPSKEQMNELLLAAQGNSDSEVTCKYCEYTTGDGKWGFKFTGNKPGYTGNSVFFPAPSGNSSNGDQGYWSGTADDDPNAWNMHLRYGFGSWQSDCYLREQDEYYLVRPVLEN